MAEAGSRASAVTWASAATPAGRRVQSLSAVKLAGAPLPRLGALSEPAGRVAEANAAQGYKDMIVQSNTIQDVAYGIILWSRVGDTPRLLTSVARVNFVVDPGRRLVFVTQPASANGVSTTPPVAVSPTPSTEASESPVVEPTPVASPSASGNALFSDIARVKQKDPGENKTGRGNFR